MATAVHSMLASLLLARLCLHGDLQRFGRRLGLYVNTAAEAIGLCRYGWDFHQDERREAGTERIAGYDTAPEACTPNNYEQLGSGHPYYCRDWRGREGWTADCAGGGGHRGLFFTAGHQWRYGVRSGSRWFFCSYDAVFTWSQHDSGRCGPDAWPRSKNTGLPLADNGGQNTCFSSLDNAVPRGTRCRLPGNAGWLPPCYPGHQHP